MKKITIYTIYKIFAVLLCMVLCLCMCGCETWKNFRKAFIDPPQPDKKVIKIGVLEPLTGRQSFDAEDEIKGIEIAHEMYPSVLGYDIELIYEDNRSDTEVCVTAAKNLVDKGCALVIGSVSDTLSLAASDVFKENKTPAISATNTVPILTETNPYYFRAAYINSFDAEGGAKYIGEFLEADRCAVFLTKDSDYEREKASRFEEDFVEMVGSDSYEVETIVYDQDGEVTEATISRPVVKYVYITGEEDQTQIDAILTSLDKEGCYTIFSTCPAETVLPFIRASRSFRFEEPVIEVPAEEQPEPELQIEYDEYGNPIEVEYDEYGNPIEVQTQSETVYETKEQSFNWIGTDQWLKIEELAQNTYGTAKFLKDVAYTIDYDPFAERSQTALAFLAAYHKKYGDDKYPTYATALGFDAYLLALRGLEDSDLEENHDSVSAESRDLLLFDSNGVFDRNRLAKKLLRVRDLVGVTGTISIDENGDPVKDIFIRQYDGSEFNVVYSVRPLPSDEEQPAESEE